VPKTMSICNTAIAKGEHVTINLQIAKLPSNTEISIPIHVFRSKAPGPVLLLLAGMHGDEVNGIDIVRKMIIEKLTVPDRGTVIAIPILNIYGFINYSREVPDGKDVNRSFPGNKYGSLASRVAYHFLREIVPHIDYGIDFHTGGGNRFNYPQIRCVTSLQKNIELAQAFAAPVILDSAFRDKSLRKTAGKMGKPIIIVFEGGESLRIDKESTQIAISGARRVMRYLDMIDEEMPKAKKSIVLKHSTWVRAHHSGLFKTELKLGQKVMKNQEVGIISDPFGEFDLLLKAPKSGIVIGLSHEAVVNQGDALFHFAY
jgi:uncharacterized protein